MKDNAPYLEMPCGLHGIDYPQKFVRAPKSLYPQKNSKTGMKVDANRVMEEVCYGK